MLASFPGFPTLECKRVRRYAGRAWYLLSCDHDIIKKDQRFRTENQHFAHCSTNCVFNAQCVWYLHTNSEIHVAYFHSFWAFRYAHMQLRFFYPLSTFDTAHVRKNTSLSLPAQLQCSRSGVRGPRNEASRMLTPGFISCSRVIRELEMTLHARKQSGGWLSYARKSQVAGRL